MAPKTFTCNKTGHSERKLYCKWNVSSCSCMGCMQVLICLVLWHICVVGLSTNSSKRHIRTVRTYLFLVFSAIHSSCRALIGHSSGNNCCDWAKKRGLRNQLLWVFVDLRLWLAACIYRTSLPRMLWSCNECSGPGFTQALSSDCSLTYFRSPHHNFLLF